MGKKIKRIILILVLCLIVGVVAYFGTMKLDKMRKGEDVNLTVTFDDTLSYVIPSITKMDKEKALLEWPYVINLENTGSSKGLYQIIINDLENSNISRDKLEYSLYLDEKEVASGNLDKIKNDILYTYEIEGNTKQEYKLYIWVNHDVEKESVYEYKLIFNTIKTGGPGF